jgi:hypothetical protein
MQTINGPKKGKPISRYTTQVSVEEEGSKRPLIVLQGARNRSQVAEDAKKILFYLLRRLSLQLREQCVFEFCYPGPQREIPTRKKERELFLAPHIEALCQRLAALRLGQPVPESKLRDAGLLNIRGPETGDALSQRLESLPPSGLVGMGKLACETLIGESHVREFSDCDWETLPCFQRIGIQKVWITHDLVASLRDPNLTVDISGTLAHAAMDIGLPIKPLALWDYKGPRVDEIWEEYQGERGLEKFTQGRWD